MRTVYVSIGNSDDKLPQAVWARFWRSVRSTLAVYAINTHGEWLSSPTERYQNACWCIDLADDVVATVKARLANTAAQYDQDSIAWAEVTSTDFIRGLPTSAVA
jgi:hypothetical protein